MARQFWQDKKTGEIWAVEVDDRGHVIGNTGPIYTVEGYLNMYTGDVTDEDTPILEDRDNDWLESHKADFVFFGDEEEIGKMESRRPGTAF
jgi:predicted kinase